MFEIAADARAKRVEVLELSEVLRELVVERRYDACADGLDADVVCDRRACELLDGVVVRIADLEGLFDPLVQANQIVVKPRRVRRGADFDGDPFMLVGLRLGGPFWRDRGCLLPPWGSVAPAS